MAENFSFQAKDERIKDILLSDQRYRVPRYQRPYSWTAEQVEELWNDVVEGSESFFLGSLVFNSEYLAKSKYLEIIDGQQRLLTLTIFLAVIRDISKELDQSLSNRIQTKSIAFEDLAGDQTFRLKPADSIIEYFEQYIQSDAGDELAGKARSAEEKKVEGNYQLLRSMVLQRMEQLPEKAQKSQELVDLFQKIADLQVIRIVISSEEDAYTIFETVNARGAELSVADLLKNLIFKNVRGKKDGVDIAKRDWAAIEENIQESGVDISRFVRHFWISMNPMVGEKRIYREIKRNVVDFPLFLEQLLEASIWYNRMLSGTKDDWRGVLGADEGTKIFNALQGFRAMRVRQVYVLLLALLRNREKIDFRLSTYVKTLENFTFMYSAISNLQANRAEKLYSTVAQEIERQATSSPAKHRSKNIARALDSLVSELRDLKPDKDLFASSFEEITYKTSEPQRIFIKYILSRINRHVGTGELDLDFDVVNIEHILPQSPVRAWGLSREEVADYVNLLGNLTLVHKNLNSTAGDGSPEEKSAIFHDSEIAITKQILPRLKDGIWDEKDIRERHAELASMAYDKVWKY